MEKLFSVKDTKNVLNALLQYYKRLYISNSEVEKLSFLGGDVEFFNDLQDDIIHNIEDFIGYGHDGDFVWDVADIYASDGCSLEQAIHWLIYAYHNEDLPKIEERKFNEAWEVLYGDTAIKPTRQSTTNN